MGVLGGILLAIATILFFIGLSPIAIFVGIVGGMFLLMSENGAGAAKGYVGCGCSVVIAIAIVFYLIFVKPNSNNQNPKSTSVIENEYHGKRGYICKFIDEHKECRIVAITKEGGNVAICGSNGYAYTGGCPKGLINALEKIHDEGHRITDVCLTDKGKYVVLYGENGFWANGLPDKMHKALSEYNDDHEALLSATVNDKGDWVVISDKHYSCSSNEICDWFGIWERKYGELLSVSITDDAQVATFKRGYAWRGNCPKGLIDAIKKTKYPKVIRMAANDWFLADESGEEYWYSM